MTSGDRRAAVDRDRVQVRASPVADAEEHRAVVAREGGRRARVRRPAGHHVAIERRGQVDRSAVVQRHAPEAGVTDRVAGPADDDERRAIRRPRDGAADTVGEGDDLRLGAAPVRVHELDGRPVGQVGIGRRRGSEGELQAVRRPGRVSGVPVAMRELSALLRLDVEDVHVLADAPQEAGAVRLVVQPVDHDRLLRPPRACGFVVGVDAGIGRGREGDLRAVRAPDGCAGAERERRQLLGLPAVARQEPDLRRPVRRPQERDRGAVRRPGG